MKRLMIMVLMLAISVATAVNAQERKMLSVEDSIWNAQVGARSIPAQQTGQLSVEEAMMPMTAQTERQMLSVQDSLWNAQMNAQATFEQPAQPSYYQNDTLYAQAVYAPSYAVAPQYAYAPPVYQTQSYPIQPATYYMSAPIAPSYQYAMPTQAAPVPLRLTHPAAIMPGVRQPEAQTVALIHTAPTRKTAKRQPAESQIAPTEQPVNPTTQAASQLTVKTAAGETQLVLSNQANAAQLAALTTIAQQQTDQAIRQAEIEHAKTVIWLGMFAATPFIIAIGWSSKKIMQELRLMAEARQKYDLLQRQESRKELEAAERLIDSHQPVSKE